MAKWTKKSAIRELKALIKKIDDLKEEKRLSESHTRWLMNTYSIIEDVFGENSKYYQNFINLSWKKNGSFFIFPSFDLNERVEQVHNKEYIRQLDTAKGILMAALDELDRSELNDVYDGKNTGPESSLILSLINLAEKKLRKIIRKIPTKEREIQDAFEDLLIAADIPYSRETTKIEYSSKTYIPDFVIDKIDFAIEIKFCSNVTKEKEFIAQINDDIMAYQTKYSNLMFIVYDLGFIRDIDRFSNSFEQNQNVIIRIIKH
jgi:hypothetical protein